MNCPEHLVLRIGNFWIWMYWRDVPRKYVPLTAWLNPFRYELVFGRWFRINEEGRAAITVSNAIFRMKQLVGLVKAN